MGWPQVTLDSVCEINVGRTPSRHEKSYWEDGIHPWVSISDMTRSRSISKTKEYFSEKARTECNMKPVPAGTVLMSFKLSIGKVSVTEQELYTNEAIAALPVIDPQRLDRHFLVRALEAIDFNDVGNRAVMGLTLNKASLKQIKIPLPPLEEQKRIAAILDQADDIRRKRQHAIDRLNQLGQAIFHEMFGGVGDEQAKWLHAPLNEICDLVRGSSPRPKGDPKYFGGDVPRLMIADITRDGMMVTPKIDSLTEAGAKKSRPMAAGSVVMAVSGAVGLPAILAKDACIHDGFVGFRNLSDKILPEFFYWFLSVSRRKNRSQGTGAIWVNLTTDQVRRFSVPLPPLKIQHEFSNCMDEVSSNMSNMRHSQDALRRLLTSLQHRAFTGQL